MARSLAATTTSHSIRSHHFRLTDKRSKAFHADPHTAFCFSNNHVGPHWSPPPIAASSPMTPACRNRQSHRHPPALSRHSISLVITWRVLTCQVNFRTRTFDTFFFNTAFQLTGNPKRRNKNTLMHISTAFFFLFFSFFFFHLPFHYIYSKACKNIGVFFAFKFFYLFLCFQKATIGNHHID